VRPSLADAVKEIDEALDVNLAASGFTGKHQKVLQRFKLESKAEDDDEEEEEEGDEEEEGVGSAEEEGAGVSGLSLSSDGAAAGPRACGDGDGGESSSGEGEEGGKEEEGEEDEGCVSSAGEEEEEADAREATTFGGRALSAPLAAAVASGKAAAAAKLGGGKVRAAVAPELPSEAAARHLVQRKVVHQAKAKAKRDAVAKAGQTRNSMKTMRKSAKASCSTSTALPTFGGW
jgi:hypothetical protein